MMHSALPPTALPLQLSPEQVVQENVRRLLIAAVLVLLASAILVGLLSYSRSTERPSPARVEIGPGSAVYKEYLALIRTQPLPEVKPLDVVGGMTPDRARIINAATPFTTEPVIPARAYISMATGADFERANDCLAAALWYEAGTDWDGQRAVAQVVLNRLRHPAFPKTVCGVVFQGSERRTGCQFSFTCDGSMRRRPPEAAWHRTQLAAKSALSGAVDGRVGLATHYHTDWVAPYWSKELDKVNAVRTHLFFRWKGNWGRPVAFLARPSRAEPGIARMAALSPQHATVLGLTAEEAESALLSYDVPLAAVGVDGPMAAAGAADPQSLQNLPKLRSGQVQLVHPEGDAFVVRLNPGSKPGAHALDALALCGSQRFCKVMGWLDDSRLPRRFPIGSISSEKMAFVFSRQNGYEAARWDCTQLQGRPPGPDADDKCLDSTPPAAPSPAAAAAVTAVAVPTPS